MVINMKRIFVSFAKEDIRLRDLLKGQARNENSSFEYIDMSVKEPWDTAWKTNCRTKIKGCDGMIAIVTKNTKNADGQIWEIRCAKEESIPIIGIYGHDDQKDATTPAECGSVKIVNWAWDNITNWLNNIK